MEDSTLEALGKSLASNNEWVSSGTILVQVHETIDPISEATEVDLASKIRISNSHFEFEFSTLCIAFPYTIHETTNTIPQSPRPTKRPTHAAEQ